MAATKPETWLDMVKVKGVKTTLFWVVVESKYASQAACE